MAVYRSDDPADTHCLCELYAPVCLDKEDQRFLGAEQASNNTGELSAIAEALLWLRDECPGPASIPAEIVYTIQNTLRASLSASPNPTPIGIGIKKTFLGIHKKKHF